MLSTYWETKGSSVTFLTWFTLPSFNTIQPWFTLNVKVKSTFFLLLWSWDRNAFKWITKSYCKYLCIHQSITVFPPAMTNAFAILLHCISITDIHSILEVNYIFFLFCESKQRRKIFPRGSHVFLCRYF